MYAVTVAITRDCEAVVGFIALLGRVSPCPDAQVRSLQRTRIEPLFDLFSD
jgi:hypothetical protein